jgi:hypothetical protein
MLTDNGAKNKFLGRKRFLLLLLPIPGPLNSSSLSFGLWGWADIFISFRGRAERVGSGVQQSNACQISDNTLVTLKCSVDIVENNHSFSRLLLSLSSHAIQSRLVSKHENITISFSREFLLSYTPPTLPFLPISPTQFLNTSLTPSLNKHCA